MNHKTKNCIALLLFTIMIVVTIISLIESYIEEITEKTYCEEMDITGLSCIK